MSVKLEHANISVRDLDAAVRFVVTAFPTWKRRGEGRMLNGARWVHVGDDDCYVAFNEAETQAAEPRAPYSDSPGLNHLGFEVDAVEPIRERLRPLRAWSPHAPA